MPAILDNPNQLFMPGIDVPPGQPNRVGPFIGPGGDGINQGEALSRSWQMLTDEVQRQQQISADRGLWSGGQPWEGGGPTGAGVVDAAQQYGQGLLAGTTAPEFRVTPGLATPRDLAPGEDLRVSTRVPTAVPKKGAELPPDPHASPDLQINIDASRNSGDAYSKNALGMRGPEYPDLPVKGLRNPDSITEAAINHMSDNLVFLHDAMLKQHGPEAVSRASQWYDGANTIAHDMADRYGYAPQQTAAVIANMSPQKDWYQNADLGDRLINIVRTKQDQGLTPEMDQWGSSYVARAQAKAAKAVAAAADATPAKQAGAAAQQAAADNLQMSLQSLQRGATLGEINDPDTRAFFVRAYDEAHNPRDYPIVTPEGGFAGPALNDDGVTPSKVGWGSFVEIKKALAALDGPGDLASISAGLGGNHKVRSFYNNIISPDAPFGDTTIDTHAIAAAHMRPLSGSDYPVEVGLGLKGSSSAATGSKGAYGIYHEAYQRAADRLGLLPRQMQSIAWEAVRGLFSPENKDNAAFRDRNYDIWQGFRNGAYDADTARRMVLDHAQGINAPSWFTPPPGAPTQ